MARILHAYLDPARMPAREELQTALQALRFRFVLDGAWVPYETQDYLPCTLEGEDAGVYVRFEREAALPEAAAALADAQGARRAVVQLRWGGDVREQMSAMLIAAALAEGFDALVIDPERGTRKTASALRAQARELHEENF
jgi:hypothetical protein